MSRGVSERSRSRASTARRGYPASFFSRVKRSSEALPTMAPSRRIAAVAQWVSVMPRTIIPPILSDRPSERVAPAQIAGLDPPREPLHALLGRAVGEGLRRHAALRLPLQPIVADGRRGVERLLHVARLEDVARALGVVRPDAREAIRLQLQPDGRRVGLRPATPALGHHAIRDPELLLDVMADLVGDHVRLREIAGGTEPLAPRAEEVQVEIDLLVWRTVERPGGGSGDAAGGLHRAVEEHQPGISILAPHAAEQRAPGVLGVGEHRRHEVTQVVVAARRSRRRGRLLRGRRRRGRVALEDHARVEAEEEGQQHENDGADAPAGHERAAEAAPVLDVVALPSAQAHGAPPGGRCTVACASVGPGSYKPSAGGSFSSASFTFASSTLICTPARSSSSSIETRESRSPQPRLSASVISITLTSHSRIGTPNSRPTAVARLTSLCARRSAKLAGSYLFCKKLSPRRS